VPFLPVSPPWYPWTKIQGNFKVCLLKFLTFLVEHATIYHMSSFIIDYIILICWYVYLLASSD
jgi:hypothetical protein